MTKEELVESSEFLRQMDIFDPSENQVPVSIIGAGGIGSIVALALTKMGMKEVDVYDHDVVDLWNVPNQMFRPNQVGDPKVEALKSVVHDLTGVSINPYKVEVGKNGTQVGAPMRGGIVVSAVDSMEVREKIWKMVKLNPKFRLLVDGRLGGESICLYSVNPCDPDQVELYESTLHSDEEGEELSCTARSIIWTTFFIGGLVARSIAKYLKEGRICQEVALDSNFLTLYQSEEITRV
ncbi:MAG TPA: hypothetical protein ENI27_00775 [bacterium]|nr:hypothetical protein [bacterium]